MAKLQWDLSGERLYETGTAKGVLFPQGVTGAYENGVAWNGLVSVKKSNDGAEENPVYADNMKYLSLMSAENLKGSIDAYTYPTEFEACDGSAAVNPGVYVGQQTRKPFGLAYATIVGNDTQGNGFGEKIHLIYNAKVSPSERAYETVNEDPNALTFSWEYSTTPVDLSDIGLEASAGITVSKHEVTPAAWKALTDMLYGTESEEAKLPSIKEVIALTEPKTP
ncbi:hypothetical protein [Pedobacter sp.]|uniref:hypothetical protein n=1 Tax=Pedobacter sp. TaxID=1411316 RepID=UPI003D7FA82C